MAKKKVLAAKGSKKASPRRPVPWLAIFLLVLVAVGLWVVPLVMDRGPVEVVFEEKR